MKLTKILSIQRIFLKFYHNYRNKLYIFLLLALYPSIKFEIFTLYDCWSICLFIYLFLGFYINTFYFLTHYKLIIMTSTMRVK